MLTTFSAALLITFILLIQQYYYAGHHFFYGQLALDSFAVSCRIIALIFFSCIYFTVEQVRSAACINSLLIYLTLLFAVFISVSSNNLLLTYVSFEIISLVFFIVLKESHAENIKSFYRSWIVSSALMLFGISIFYGLSGSLNYTFISIFLSANPVNKLVITLTVLMIFSGFAFRLFVFPFQSFISGILDGIDGGKSSLILISSAIAGLAGLARFIFSAFNEINTYNTSNVQHALNPVFNHELFFTVVICISMLSSSLVLFLKKDLAKINLYLLLINLPLSLSGMTFAGYSSLTPATLMLLQTLLPFTAISIVLYLLRSQNNIKTIAEINGLSRAYPFLTAVLLINMLSLGGMPLTMGFTSRLYIFSALSPSITFPVAAITVISSMIIFYKIFRMTLSIFRYEPNGIKKGNIKLKYTVLLSILSLFLMFFGIFFTLLTDILNIISNITYFQYYL